MAQHAGTFDANLAAAAGADPELMAELRAAFVESLTQQIDLLGRARCDANWEITALRLRGLAASFHYPELMRLAQDALDCAPGEPVVLHKLQRLCADFTGQGRPAA